MKGRWRIMKMPDYVADYPDMMEPAYILFDGQGGGEFAFGCVTGAIYGAGDAEATAVEFTWDGNDEMDSASGGGWAKLQPNGALKGQICFHNGDDANSALARGLLQQPARPFSGAPVAPGPACYTPGHAIPRRESPLRARRSGARSSASSAPSPESSGASALPTSAWASPSPNACNCPKIVADCSPAAARRWTPPKASWRRGLRDLLPDPSRFKDMDAAAARVATAIQRNEKIAIFGDYDVDGATSAALLSRFLRAVGAQPIRLYVPDRGREGYGPNAPALLKLKEEGAGLVITVDCGIAAFAAAASRQRPPASTSSWSITTFAEPLLPQALRHRQSQPASTRRPGHGQMAAIGVAFLLVVAANRKLRLDGWYNETRPEPDLMQWLDLVALGTVCDVVR